MGFVFKLCSNTYAVNGHISGVLPNWNRLFRPPFMMLGRTVKLPLLSVPGRTHAWLQGGKTEMQHACRDAIWYHVHLQNGTDLEHLLKSVQWNSPYQFDLQSQSSPIFSVNKFVHPYHFRARAWLPYINDILLYSCTGNKHTYVILSTTWTLSTFKKRRKNKHPQRKAISILTNQTLKPTFNCHYINIF